MKIVIGGGTGFIGQYLQKYFEEKGDTVKIISRRPEYVQWNRTEITNALEGADLLINLAGKSINCRFTPENRQEILISRIATVRLLNRAIQDCENPPKLWVNASATGIYRQSWENESTEFTGEFGNDFLAKVVSRWEREFFNVSIPGVRKVALRTAVVLGEEGGVYPIYRRLVKSFLGGYQGNGSQYVSWIHIEDYLNIILYLLENVEIDGVINASAPHPLPNNTFMEVVRNQLNVPFGVFAPKPFIHLASILIGIQPALILNSYNVVSQKLKEVGFEFKYPILQDAMHQLTSNE